MVFFEKTARKTWTEGLIVFCQELFTLGTVGALLIFVATSSYSVNDESEIQFNPLSKKEGQFSRFAPIAKSLGFKTMNPGQGEFDPAR